jgi:glycosyltransferase involved in cell wall biosynthesis
MAQIDWVVMPSIWWENAPLVIQEAFQHRRPVITSGIGGMAEMVRDGIDGLHVRPGDAAHLAATMRRAIDEPDLWPRLVEGIAAQPTLAKCARAHRGLFDELRVAVAA